MIVTHIHTHTHTKVLIDNAEKKGVMWRDEAQKLMDNPRLQQVFDTKFAQSHAQVHTHTQTDTYIHIRTDTHTRTHRHIHTTTSRV